MPGSRYEPQEFADYEPFLTQERSWPSPDGTNHAIESMSPQHAISAYRKLCRWADERPSGGFIGVGGREMRKTILGQALINQALGHEAPALPELITGEDVLEVLIEGSSKATEADALFHFRVARGIADHLDDQQLVITRL